MKDVSTFHADGQMVHVLISEEKNLVLGRVCGLVRQLREDAIQNDHRLEDVVIATEGHGFSFDGLYETNLGLIRDSVLVTNVYTGNSRRLEFP